MRLAADANVLLAAVVGGRARLILSHPGIEKVFTTESTFSEVEEYALQLAAKKGLRSDIVLLATAALPVTIVEPREYSKNRAAALRRIGNRDPDDAELLALALHFQISVWSNDRDFEGLAAQLFTTEDLHRHLKIIR